MPDDSDSNQWYGLSDSDVKAMKEMYADFKSRRLVQPRPFIPANDAQTPEVYIARTPDEVEGVDEGEDLGTGHLTGTGSINPVWDDVPSFSDCIIYRMTGEDDNPRLEPIDGLTHRVFNLSVDILPTSTWIIILRDKFGTWWANYGTPPMVKGKLDGAMVYTAPETGTGPFVYVSAVMSIWADNGYQEVDTGYNVTVFDWFLQEGDTISAGKRVIAFYCPRSRKYYLVNAECE